MAKTSQAEPAAQAAAPDPASPDLTPTTVRVLTPCCYGQANDVAVMPACEVAAAKADSLVDDDPAAVAYAKSLQAAGD